ncbi:hypothetical protein K501DRAFT_144659, partial [Backusella circina FSU 941]
MKTVQLLFDGKQFDEQYTFDLQNNLSIHDFHSIIGLFNQASRMRPPPTTKIVWLFTLAVIWAASSLFFYTLWHFYIESVFLLLLLPAFLVASLFLLVFRHRSIRKKFEKNILNICSRVNATENIRGIHFRFFKNGEDVNRQVALSGFVVTATYELIIEFDDRFNILKSRQFNK